MLLFFYTQFQHLLKKQFVGPPLSVQFASAVFLIFYMQHARRLVHRRYETNHVIHVTRNPIQLHLVLKTVNSQFLLFGLQ